MTSRWLLVLAGCGRIGFDPLGGPGLGDGNGELPGDALPAACQHAWATDVVLGYRGTFYSLDETDQVATFLSFTSGVELVSPADTGTAMPIVANRLQPRLAPSGTELYVADSVQQIFYDVADNTGTWMTTGQLAFATPPVELGTRSSTTPSRMVVTAGGGMFELELANATWNAAPGTLANLYPPGAFGMFDDVTDPALSPDGLRLAFAADLTSTGVYVPVVAVRASLAERFSGAVRFDITSGLTPYLTQDCNALYYTASDNFVHRVTR